MNLEIQSAKFVLSLVYTETGEITTKEATLGDFKDVTKKTTTSYKYIWSEKSYLEGWEFTGRTKTVTKNYTAGQR